VADATGTVVTVHPPTAEAGSTGDPDLPGSLASEYLCPGHRGWSPDHRRGHLGDLDRPARYRYRAGWVRRIHDLRRTGPPTVDALQFPATQNYDNGTVIRWDEPTSEGGRETLHPESGVATADGTTPTDSSHRTATFVAVVGVLTVAAITAAGVLAVHRRRAGSPHHTRMCWAGEPSQDELVLHPGLP